MTGRAKASFDVFTTRAAWMRRLVFILLIFGGLCLGAVSGKVGVKASSLLQAMSTNIVISQFRTNGSGGPTDEFIELFNPTTGTIDISGWKIRYSASNGVPITRCTISSVPLAPGQHYLIASNGFDDGYVVDLACDLSISDDGGIALTLFNDIVVDAVGMGTGTIFKEGTVLSPLNEGDNSYMRQPENEWHGCFDDDNNSNDFVVSSPAQPKNTSSPPINCGNVPTATSTATITETPTPVALRAIAINEVAWAGTAASPYDEWIELYNTTNSYIDLTGWTLSATNIGTILAAPNISLGGIIPPYGYFLLEGGDDSAVSNIQADQIFADNQNVNLSNNGAIINLYSHIGEIVDTANINGGMWDGGSSYSTINSMERRAQPDGMPFADGTFAWMTFKGPDSYKYGRDANGVLINGSPRGANWANDVTPTPTFTPTRTATPTVTRTATRAPSPTITRTPTLIRDFVVLNEVLPHALTDLNGDGVADVGDEYIELINLSTFTVSLQGWLLDDYDPSTRGYALPPVLMSPGQKLAFFASQTGQYLSDGGDSVVLIRPGGKPADILTYPVLEQLGLAWCRIPDGVGTWFFGCIPTPNQANIYQPEPIPTSTPLPDMGGSPSYFDACPLTDVDEAIELAECILPGLDIWNPSYWDAPDFNSLPMYLEDENSKPVSLE